MRFDVVVTPPAFADSSAWAVILPVKPLVTAKSRLSSDEFPSVQDLAMAFFQDTATAVLACPAVSAVIVVTTDPDVAHWSLEHDCTVADDSSVQGINAAAGLAARHVPPGMRTAVMVADLPCLTPDALDSVLRAGLGHRSAFLADAEGSGTTTWLCEQPFAMPRFGANSRAAHVAAGAVDLVAMGDHGAWTTARRDIDTASDLAAARLIGLGTFTSAALKRAQAITG